MNSINLNKGITLCRAWGFFIALTSQFIYILPTSVYALPKSIVVGVQHDYPPYIYEENGEMKGISIELAEAAFSNIGISVSYKKYPFPRMLEYGRSGKVDAIMLVFKTPERESYLFFPEHDLYTEENFLVTRKNFQISYNGDLRTLRNHTVGVIRGFSYGDSFDQATFIKRDESLDDKMLLKKLLANRYDVAVGSKIAIIYQADRLSAKDDIVFLEPSLFEKKSLYIAFSKNVIENKALYIQFSSALEKLKESGEYEKTMEKYGLK
ncbi:substrate-binding periplasmic protein [Aeromonas veronii]|uniref:substrate-binding periplasmic protein n=1 Tax=Aeromonas veronii TaxID=654 RepID=UPI0013967F16|nr:transporter substrate-binding domain-containing protein [Aeromonas veronii]HDO1314194.1 amino acid ABC transporter substrate-binding protein [Aeromonas veronii]